MAEKCLSKGRFGEEIASSYLQEKGYKILDRNWRCRKGELDIICTRSGKIIFVEVKTRSASGMGQAEESLRPSQAGVLLRTASSYLSCRGWWDRECRFDFISVVMGREVDVKHVKNAIEFSFMGRGNAPWQPW
ncbi:MAG: YraN family protein [Desulfonatronovibrionaceae bacterium]